MEKLPNSIEIYLSKGDPVAMDKVKRFLIENLNINENIDELLTEINFQEITEAIALHINIDLENLDNEQKSNHIIQFATVVKLIFRLFIKSTFEESGNIGVLKLIDDVEDNLQLANWTHNNCLTEFIKILDFNSLRENYLKPVHFLEQNNTKPKVTLVWNKDVKKLDKLAKVISEDYDIIKVPARFKNYFLKADEKKHLSVNEKKIGHFVYLIDRLIQDKFVILKGGKGFWALLAETTFDYENNLLDKNKSKFKTINSNLKKEINYNNQIINEIEAIFKQIES